MKKEILKALNLDKIGDWNGAHEIVQLINTQEAYWVHAYLHRKEGDIWNADYWYRRANKKRPDISFEEEWELIYTGINTSNVQ
jgi:hypothetical protein